MFVEEHWPERTESIPAALYAGMMALTVIIGWIGTLDFKVLIQLVDGNSHAGLTGDTAGRDSD